MSHSEPVNMPEIGTVVRCRASLLSAPTRTSGRVKAILCKDNGLAVVIQSIWGAEITVAAREYSRFFEECDSEDIAREYRAST